MLAKVLVRQIGLSSRESCDEFENASDIVCMRSRARCPFSTLGISDLRVERAPGRGARGVEDGSSRPSHFGGIEETKPN